MSEQNTIPVTGEQIRAKKKLEPLLRALRRKNVGSVQIDCFVTVQGIATVTMSLRDGLRWIKCKPIVFAAKETDYDRIVEMLRSEYLALHAANFDKTYLPAKHLDDGSPVSIEEGSLESDDVYF